ncbi:MULTISPECIES: membrane protein [Pseudomonas]|uniref:Membrane protein n=1 Tax=Pseudomonas fulva TaxID=47880 RepID=A0A0D0JUL9_9PSED|nr:MULTISPECIES: membrane protein [Pseudomonas]KIP88695.1 membrane protein [Pseudomonas fulva]
MSELHQQGPEAPYTPLGPFKLRLPFIHYRFEISDYMQGLLMCAVDLAAIPLMTEFLGMPFEVALAVVMLNGLLYLIHHLLGDPVVPGWITPAIPMLMAYCSQFPEGAERVHALIAFQLMLGIFSIGLGMTGMARRVVSLVPSALKAGIIMGAGLSAVVTVFKEGGRFDAFPWTISIAIGVAFYLVFSMHFQELKKRNRFWWNFAKLGIFPIILLAVIVAPIFGEAPWPSIEWGISKPDFITLWNEYTVFGLGMPPLMMFVTAIPTVLAAYLVVFGDVLSNQAILDEGGKVRRDEKIDFDPNRSHLLFGGRNALMSILGPDVAMCGPQWAAMQVVITERFKGGAKAMKSIYGGVGSFRWGTNTGLLLLPVVTLVQPILGVALALTLLIQGYVSVRLGIMEARSQRDLGIAGVIGAVLAIKGAGWAFAIGLGLCLLIYGTRFFRGENDQTFSKDLPPAEPVGKD